MKSKHCGVSQNMHQGLLFCVTEKLMILFKVQHNYFRYFQDLSWVTSMWRQKKKKKENIQSKCVEISENFTQRLGNASWVIFLMVDGNGSSGILQAVMHPIWCHKLKSVSTQTADTARRERMCLFTCFWASVHLCHISKQKCVFRLSFIVPFGSWCCVETTVLNSAKTSLSYHMYQESHTLIWAQNSGGKSLDICDDAGYYLNTSVYFP